MSTVDVFVDVALVAYGDGILSDALAELAVRLDLAGAGEVLDQLMFTCWANEHGVDRPGCRCFQKKDPNPRPLPRPQPPPPPKDPKS
jgi:hypothetical protein